MRNFFERSTSGQAALPFVLLVAGIIVEIVAAGTIIGFVLTSASLGEQLSARALAAANTGVYDAVMKASNNKEFAASTKTYSITVGSDTVSVEVSRSTDDPNNVYAYIATSTATARNRERRMKAEFLVNQSTGEISVQSIAEVPTQ